MLELQNDTVYSDEEISLSSSVELQANVGEQRVGVDQAFQQARSTVLEKSHQAKPAVVFDLPAKFYKGNYLAWKNNASPKQTEALKRVTEALNVDTIGEFEPKDRKPSRFSNINPDVLLQRLEKRDHYQFLRNAAIDAVEKELFHQLNLCLNMKECTPDENDMPDFEIPHRMFSWAREDFLARRKIRKLVWVDLIKMHYEGECLETKKLEIDVAEVKRYVRLITKALRHGEHDIVFGSKGNVINYIADTYDFLGLYDDMRVELAKNKTILLADLKKSVQAGLSKRDSKQRNLHLQMEEIVTSYDEYSPIEMRYQIHHYQSVVDVTEHRHLKTLDDYEKEIGHYVQLHMQESYCNQCIMNSYYIHIEKYKESIAQLSTKYNIEYDLVDNQMQYRQLALDKLREQYLFCKQEIIRFHQEIYSTLIKLKVEQEQDELKYQRAMELAALKAAKALRKRQQAMRKKKK